MILFIEYPKCSTCQRARKYLETHGIEFVDRHIKENRPSADEISAWHKKFGIPLKKLFNTSGLLYKELKLSERLPSMTEAEQIELLASDGMLVKRPIVVGDDFLLVGFREEQWDASIRVI